MTHDQSGLDRPALEAVFDATIAAVEDCRAAVIDYLQPYGLDARLLNRIEVILEELVSNVVRHNVGATTLRVTADCRDGAVHLAIADDGTAFDPLQAPEAPPFTTLDEAKRGEKLLELLDDEGHPDGLIVLAPHGADIEPFTHDHAEHVLGFQEYRILVEAATSLAP